jgi:hypothetical protein
MAIETATVGTKTIEPAVEVVTAAAPEADSTVAPEASMKARVDPLGEASTQVVIREVMIEVVALLCSAPMQETGSSSRGGFELLDGNLIDPAFVSLSMESWHRTENSIKVHYEDPKFVSLMRGVLINFTVLCRLGGEIPSEDRPPEGIWRHSSPRRILGERAREVEEAFCSALVQA